MTAPFLGSRQISFCCFPYGRNARRERPDDERLKGNSNVAAAIPKHGKLHDKVTRNTLDESPEDAIRSARLFEPCDHFLHFASPRIAASSAVF